MDSKAVLPPKYSKFLQQQLPAWRPILTPIKVMIYFGVIAVFSFLFGALFYVSYGNTIQYEVRYDDKCELKDQNCEITFDIKEEIKGKVYLKYKLTNYYQNHRRFMESKNRDQLAGKYVDYDGMSSCEPIISVDDSKEPADWIIPCGVSATSVFNDTFTVQGVEFSESGIAWDCDEEWNYSPLSKDYTEGNLWLKNSPIFPGDQTNEHFIVWMRVGAFPTVIKKYAICNDCTIPKGELKVTIQNNYPTSLFEGEKSLILLKDSSVKSKNDSMGIIFLFIGALCTLFLILTILERFIFPRKLGDMALIQEIIAQKDKELAIHY